MDCGMNYVKETGKKLSVRLIEHMKNNKNLDVKSLFD